jgi:hypothetical protein
MPVKRRFVRIEKRAPRRRIGCRNAPGHLPAKEIAMAKGQAKSNKEARKPKKEKPPKGNASNPSTKPQAVGMVTIKS